MFAKFAADFRISWNDRAGSAERFFALRSLPLREAYCHSIRPILFDPYLSTHAFRLRIQGDYR